VLTLAKPITPSADEDPARGQAPLMAEEPRKVIEEYESNPGEFRGDRLLAVAISYAEAGRYDQARPIYEQFLRDHPTHARALRGLGNIHFLQKRYDEAVACLRRAWELGDQQSLAALALAHLRAGKPGGMEYLIPSLLEHKRGNVEIVNCLLAYVLDRSRKDKEPLNTRLLLEALEGLPDMDVMRRDDTALLMSEVDGRLKDHVELWNARVSILRKITRGYEADPLNWPKARRGGVADAYGILQQYGKAEPIYRLVLNDQPNDVDALWGLGTLLAYERRFREAVTTFRKAWALGKRESLLGLSAAYIGLGDFEGMRDLVPHLLERRKEDGDFLMVLLAYAVKVEPPDREVFFKAIDGVTDEQLVRREDTAGLAVTGLRLFGEKERAERLLKLRAEQAKVKKV
jgi:tetratricopeptide (TPR) repeat protein